MSYIFRFFKCLPFRVFLANSSETVTNFYMLVLVMGFISLVDETEFMRISSRHYLPIPNVLCATTILLTSHFMTSVCCTILVIQHTDVMKIRWRAGGPGCTKPQTRTSLSFQIYNVCDIVSNAFQIVFVATF